MSKTIPGTFRVWSNHHMRFIDYRHVFQPSEPISNDFHPARTADVYNPDDLPIKDLAARAQRRNAGTMTLLSASREY